MNSLTPSPRFTLCRRLAVALAVCSLSAAPGRAADILFVVNSVVDVGFAANANDQEVYDRLTAQGHNVTLADDQDAALGDLALGKDLILISSSVGSGNQPLNSLASGPWRTGRTPVVNYEPALADELRWQTADTFGNAGGHESLAINEANQGHPLAAGKSGTVMIVEPGFTATVSSSALPLSLGADAILIATVSTPGNPDFGRAAIWAFEKGSRLADDATVTTGRRVAFFYNASTAPGVYNQDARDLFDAAITWALSPPPDLPILVVWTSPPAVAAPPGAPIVAELEDSAVSQVDPASIELTLNGTVVTPTVSQAGSVTRVSFTPPTILPAGSRNTAVLTYKNKGTPPETFTSTFEFVVVDFVTLPASLAYPVGATDPGAPGFRARVVQANTFSGTLPNSEERAEAQLAGTLIDPLTGAPYTDDSTPAGTADGFHLVPGVINWNQDAQGLGAEQGNFRDPDFPDDPIPGIPGIDGFNTDNIAAEVITYLELAAGAHQFGVNSDDGFVLAVGPDPRDALRLPLGRFDGGRGSADSLFSFVAETPGVYCFRLLWYEGNGGANLEFFSVDPATGEKILINDTANPRAIKAWRQLVAPTKPYVRAASPRPGARRVPVTTSLEFQIADGGLAVDPASVQLTFDGTPVAPPALAVTKNAGVTTVTYDPPGDLAGTTQFSVQLRYQDTATPPVTYTRVMSFTTERPPIQLPPVRQSADGLVVLEAENFDAQVSTPTHAWEFDQTPADWSGDGVMYALPEAATTVNLPDALTGSPRLDYKIDFVKTGTHYLWFRGSDGGGNSLHAGFDDEDPTGTNLDNMDSPGCCGTRLIPGGTTFTWVNGTDAGPEFRATFEVLTAGEHTLHIWMREDGQIVDKLLITTDPNFTPVGQGPPESSRVGEPIPPLVSISSPAGGSEFAKGAPITILADASDTDGTIIKVEFFAGTEKVGEDTTPPFSVTFQSNEDRPFTLTARAADNSGLTTTSQPVKIIVGDPVRVLFVGNNPTANAGDLVIINRLEERRFAVTAVDDNDSQTSDADGKDLVVISSTVGSGNVNVKFTSVPIPIVNWEEALMDDLKLTGDSAANPDHHGTTGSQTALQVVRADHPLAGGLPVGTVEVYTSPQTISWGYPEANAANAIIIATVVGNPNQVAIFGYETGATLFDGVTPAPARRVGFFLNGDSTTALTAAGLALVDAAINWALGLQATPPLTIARVTDAGNGVTLAWDGATAPFLIQTRPGAAAGEWLDLLTTDSRTATVPKIGETAFYRVVAGAPAAVEAFTAVLSGAAEVGDASPSSATGRAVLALKGNTLWLYLSYAGLSGNATAMHIHGPAATTESAGVMIPLPTPPPGGAVTMTATADVSALTAEQRAALRSGRTYLNVHTANKPPGEIRGQVAPLNLAAVLSGGAEVPPVDTPASGAATLTLLGNQLLFDITYADLKADASAAHIHGPAAPTASAGVLVPLPTPTGRAGRLTGSLSLSQQNLGLILDGLTYINIHSGAHPGGEIRGQIGPKD